MIKSWLVARLVRHYWHELSRTYFKMMYFDCSLAQTSDLQIIYRIIRYLSVRLMTFKYFIIRYYTDKRCQKRTEICKNCKLKHTRNDFWTWNLSDFFVKLDTKIPIFWIILATEKNKKRIVPSKEVIKSDLTIRFSVVDLVGKEVWLVDFFLKCGFFQRLKSEK